MIGTRQRETRSDTTRAGDPATQLSETGEVQIAPCGYTVRRVGNPERILSYEIDARIGDANATTGVFAPWVEDLLVRWFYGPGEVLLTRSAELLRTNTSVTVLGTRVKHRDEVAAFMTRAVSSPAAVIPCALAETITVIPGERPARRVTRALELIDPEAARTLSQGRVSTARAVHAWAQAYDAAHGTRLAA